MAKNSKSYKAEKILPDENKYVADVKTEPKTSNLYNQYSKDTIKASFPKNTPKAKENLHLSPSIRDEKKLFKKLKKMITGPDILPNLDKYIQGKMTRKQAEKVARYEEYFKKIQSMTYFGVMQNDGDRRLRYMEYDRMEWMSPEVGRALDALASDATTLNEENQVVKVMSKHGKITEEANDLFNNILDIKSNLFYWIRDTLKYGDSFFTLHIDAHDGIKKAVPAPVEQCEREVGYDEQNPFAHRFKIAGLGEEYLQPYEVAHFRLKASVDFGEYGKSVLENARRIWRQLITIEDSMLIYRLVRAPERRIFYFDVGNLSPESVEAAINKYSSEMKKEKIYDTEGNIDYRMSLQPLHKDTKVPLLDNRILTLEELAKEYEEGKVNWTYSIDDKTHKLKPGKIKWAGKNYSDAKILKVELDNGSYVLSHPSHPFILRDGSSLAAEDLKPYMSLMPFYSKINNSGYEETYEPGTNKTKMTHTFVARDTYNDEFKVLDENHETNDRKKKSVPIVHHKGITGWKNNKLNNSPENLIPMNWEEHATWHKIQCNLTLNNPEALEKRKKRLIEYNKTKANSDNTIYYNKLYKKAEHMGEIYNNSELHKFHNIIRRKAMKDHWKNGGHKIPSVIFDKYIWNSLNDAINTNKIISQKSAVDFINNNLIDYLIKLNPACTKLINNKKISKILIKAKIQELGFKDFEDYHKNNIINHKVKSISVWHETEDVYCMTIIGDNGQNDRHNFAIIPENCMENDKSSPYKMTRHSGLFVKNSVEEDIFVPTRGGHSNTKIETLPAQQWAVIDDVKYLHDKFIAALAVPNDYLGYENSMGSTTTLGNQDIRYSKFVERIQRSILETLNDILMIHLYIKGYKSLDLSEIELSLTNPSHINELQQLEILASRFDLYQNAKENGIYSSYWLKKNILDLTDEEIEQEELNVLRDNIVDFTKMQAQEGVLLTVKDVLDYNNTQNQAAANAMGMDAGMPGGAGGMSDFGPSDDFGDMGGADIGGIEPDIDTSMGDAEDLADEVEDIDLATPEI
jgi:hypothetical protein